MFAESQIPEPVLFNPLKHHLGYIREFIDDKTESSSLADNKALIKDLKHLGSSVMDIYTGTLTVGNISDQVILHLGKKKTASGEVFSQWTGTGARDSRTIPLSDGSRWVLKYHENSRRFVHVFPARGSMHTFRVKSNTLKSALLYYILVGKDFITGNDLNRVRPLLGLSPVKDPVDAEAIIEMIEIIRSGI